MDSTKVQEQDIICALATAQGVGAIAIIRVSGKGSIELVNSVFKGKDLTSAPTHTVHFGTIVEEKTIIDEVLISVFRNPKSFTKEDSIEISCHGSDYIIHRILALLIKKSARVAQPGEFTQRAFLNGQFDLVQAEAVADLIAADSEASHKTALNQLRGGFSKQLAALRSELIHFASLVELELDFGEEDVEFAERDDLRQLIHSLNKALIPMIDSFSYGNALKEGIPVAIIGSPNVGKSTLLNTLLNEEKAIVTPIAGTTRDVIEDTVVLNGLKFRFIDTAGIRETSDVVEAIGIERSKQAMEKADVVLFLYDSQSTFDDLQKLVSEIGNQKHIVWVQNKADLQTPVDTSTISIGQAIAISAAKGEGIESLQNQLVSLAQQHAGNQTVVTNLRHYQHLVKTHDALNEVLTGLDTGITGDFLAQDIRLALYHLGEITGTIVTDDLLANIFSKFCIGK